jgi:hypothetical protein
MVWSFSLKTLKGPGLVAWLNKNFMLLLDGMIMWLSWSPCPRADQVRSFQLFLPFPRLKPGASQKLRRGFGAYHSLPFPSILSTYCTSPRRTLMGRRADFSILTSHLQKMPSSS